MVRFFQWVLFFLLFNIVFSATAQITISRLSTSNGLSQGMISDIIQDKDGFVWVGTNDGLNRYDGYQFKTFKHNPTIATSISGNIINHLFEDHRGLLWMSVNNTKLNCYDKRTGRFFDVTDKLPNLFPARIGVTKIFQTANKKLWLANDFDVFEVTIPPSFPDDTAMASGITIKKIPALHNDAYFKVKNEEQNVSLFEKNTLAIYLAGKISLYNTDTKQRLAYGNEACFDNQLSYFIDTASGSIWSFTQGKLYHTQPNKLLSATPIALSNWSASVNGVATRMNRDRSGVFYLLFDKGVVRINAQDSAKHAAVYQSILEKGSLNTLFLGTNNRVWLGTNGYGLYTGVGKDPLFKKVGNEAVYDMYAIDDSILTFRNLYRASNSQKVHLVQFDENGIFPFKKKLDTTQLMGIAQIDQNAYYQLQVFLINNDLVIKIKNTLTQDTFHLYLQVELYKSKILLDTKKNLWVSANPLSINCIWRNTHQVATYSFASLFNKEDGLVKINHIYEANNHIYWLSTTAGLLKMEITLDGKPQFFLFRNSPLDAHSLASNFIQSVIDDPELPNQFLWVCTKGEGIDKLDKTTGRCVHFSTKEGLPNDVVYGALPDSWGRLWLSTNNGISCFSPQKRYFHNFSMTDGLQDNEFNTSSFLQLKDGRLLFGGVSGINIINPKDFVFDSTFSPVFFTKLFINNQPIELQDSLGILKQPIEATRLLNLKYYQNFINVSFAATNFQNLGINKYRYKLDGVDDDWVFANTRNDVSYPNLPPGTYTLHVVNSNENGDWNPAEARITFVISPPWWRTIWAYGIYLATLSGILWGLYRLQWKRERLKNELAFKAKEAHQLAELDAFKSRFFTNITHELRTPLTLILEPSRDLLNRKETTKGNAKLQSIFNNSLLLLRLVNTLLDIAKLESGKMTLHYAEGDVVPIVQLVFESFQPMAEKRGIRLRFYNTSEVVNASFDRLVVEKITFNLLSNALKFTPRGGRIMIAISQTQPDYGGWMLEVIDTGIGIKANEQAQIFNRFYQIDNSNTRRGEGTGIGLSLVKELVEQMGGTIQVQSTEGVGSRFAITFPLNPSKRSHHQTTLIEQSSENEVSNTEATLADNGANNSLWATGEIAIDTPTSTPLIQDTTNEKEEYLVLIVDDNEEMCHFLSLVMQEEGFAVCTASNGQEGIEKALEMMPNIIISDVMMPIKDGYDLVHELKNNTITCHIPIMLLTAKQSLSAKMDGYKTGADAYLSKPFHTPELLVRMQQLLILRKKLQTKYKQLPIDPHSQLLINSTNDGLKPTNDTLNNEPPTGVKTLDDIFLEQANRYIDDHLDDDKISLDNMAGHLTMSRTQLYRKITSLTGLSPVQYIRNRKLDKAYLLINTQADLRINEVMLMVGILDKKYFTSVFKDRFGVIPSAVAKKNYKTTQENSDEPA